MTERAHEYKLKILEQHLDTFGHVNNATYLQLLEQARWEWITSGGYGLDRVAELQQGPTVLECSLKFQRELRNREDVVIRSWVESYVGKVARVRQDLFKQGGELSCSASFAMGFFDLKLRKLIAPSEAWLACFGWTKDEWQPK